jgi:hypothetical protein
MFSVVKKYLTYKKTLEYTVEIYIENSYQIVK